MHLIYSESPKQSAGVRLITLSVWLWTDCEDPPRQRTVCGLAEVKYCLCYKPSMVYNTDNVKIIRFNIPFVEYNLWNTMLFNL